MNKKETNYEGGADLLNDGAVKNLGNIALRAIQIEVDLAGVPQIPRLPNRYTTMISSYIFDTCSLAYREPSSPQAPSLLQD